MTSTELTEWLLDSDVSVQYQVYRDLLKTDRPDLKARIATEGWGAKFLSLRKGSGHWGMGFYQPKWISTHYTLLDLKNLGIPNQNRDIDATLEKIIHEERGSDGGINPARSVSKSDVCINGMFLNYACYFGINENHLKPVVDFLLSQHMADGGFNCRLNRYGATHSSLHTTISVLEGITEYSLNGYTYRLQELMKAGEDSIQFLLEHRLFKSHRTGEIIDKRMLMLSYPSRWYYDILRSLDYFRYAGIGFDERMSDAIDILIKKQQAGKTWPLQARHPGQTHFEMEIPGRPSRWNTLRARRVLNHYNIHI